MSNSLTKKVILIFTVFFSMISCSNKKVKVIDNKKITKIEISYVDLFDYLTPIAISCDDFGNKFFEKDIKKKIIIEDEELNAIESYLKETEQINKVVRNIDVRFKMILYSENKVADTICGSGSTIKIDEINYLISKKFSSFLYKITETK